jgi:glycosyltransferase involved in cell wall biosynthesis
MHILLIHQAFAALDEAGGTRHYELAHYLAAHGHTVTIIASPVSYLTGKTRQERIPWVVRETPEPGITILRTYTYPAFHKSFVHRVFSFFSFMVSSFFNGLSVRKVDLVWGTSPPIFQGFTAWLLARLKGVPFLFEVRDLWPAFAIAIGVLHNKLLISLSLWLEHFLYSHADQVMVNSPGFIEHVTSRGARHVVLVPNSADPAMFDSGDCARNFRKYNHFDNKFVVLYAGAHGISNDLDVVLQAAALLKKDDTIQLVLVGDGKEKPALQSQAQQLSLSNVLFVPPVPKNEMADVLASADACIAILKPLELYKTTYPNKVFDYMAAGRPVICAIDGVIRQVVEEADAGCFVTPGDPQAMAVAIQSLAADPARTQQLGKNGRRYIENKFNRATIAEQLMILLVELRKGNG